MYLNFERAAALPLGQPTDGLDSMMSDLPTLERYIRQVRFPPLGEAGQRRLTAATAVVCGCGALGSMAASWLVRAGVGRVRIVDRDFVDSSNLQRQVLFDEDHARTGAPKAVAAAETLRRANSEVSIEAVVADLDHRNIAQVCGDAGVLVDGTDNFETRFLINDFAVHAGTPWVFGACLGATGQTMTILPGITPCLRCLIPECPPPGATETCDTAGILGPVVGVVASLEALEAIKVLSGNREATVGDLRVIDLWTGRQRTIAASHLRASGNCPACQRGELHFLTGRQGSRTAVLCGRNAVQLGRSETIVDLTALAERLRGVGEVVENPYLVRLKTDGYEITVFADGRAIVAGTDDPSLARTVHAKYVGS